VRDQTKIDPLVRSALQEDWPLSRLDTTVRAILRAGTFEILERKDVPVAVIVTEYVEIARAFFENDEPKLVNAVLDRIAKQVRGEVKR
jgi:N utilization substance protein B